MRKVLLDVHTHTVASGHAYSSLQEMAQAAADKGLQVLGITEHGPSIVGTCPLVYFRNMFVVPRQLYGVKILMAHIEWLLSTATSHTLSMLNLGKELLGRKPMSIEEVSVTITITRTN
jgi:hypothetical protein